MLSAYSSSEGSDKNIIQILHYDYTMDILVVLSLLYSLAAILVTNLYICNHIVVNHWNYRQ